jgi:hypothetical protein
VRRGRLDVGNDFTERGIRLEVHERETRVAEDSDEQIVEVVRDAAREDAETLQLLRVLHFRLEGTPLCIQPPQVRDVLTARDHAECFAVHA